MGTRAGVSRASCASRESRPSGGDSDLECSFTRRTRCGTDIGAGWDGEVDMEAR